MGKEGRVCACWPMGRKGVLCADQWEEESVRDQGLTAPWRQRGTQHSCQHPPFSHLIPNKLFLTHTSPRKSPTWSSVLALGPVWSYSTFNNVFIILVWTRQITPEPFSECRQGHTSSSCLVDLIWPYLIYWPEHVCRKYQIWTCSDILAVNHNICMSV